MISVSTITSCFRGERYLAKFLESVVAQTIFDEIEVVLVHNEPSEYELELVRDFQAHYPGRLQHLVVQSVEPLGASWNRSWRAARGHYVCIWNVDDLRTSDSLQCQRDALGVNPDAALVYGDFQTVSEFGKSDGPIIDTPEFDPNEFTRGFPIGPFPMWRRAIGEQVGYFDEQLRSGADFDLAVRIALNFRMRRVPNLLGYFTDAGIGLGTGSLFQPIERTVIELRYGIYDKIDYDYLPRAARYDIPHLLQFGLWVPVSQFVPDYEDFIQDRCNRWFVLGIDNYFATKNNSVNSRSSRRRLLKGGLGWIRAVNQTVRQRIGR